MSDLDVAIEAVKEKYGSAGVASDLGSLQEEIVSVVRELMEAMWEPATDEEWDSWGATVSKADALLSRVEREPDPPRNIFSEDVCSECRGSLDDGEGWAGRCGNCADSL